MKIQRVAGVLLFLAGVVWTIGFPKTSNVSNLGFVSSVLISLGFFVTGVTVYTFEHKRLALTVIGLTLFASLLVNTYLMAELHAWQRMSLDAREQSEQKARLEAGLTHEQRVELLKVRESVEQHSKLHEQRK